MAVNQLENIDIHQFLKIYQMNGFTRNLSENSDMWSHFTKLKEMDPQARLLKYLLITELGYGAVQAMSADGSGAFPKARRSKPVEAEARYKEWAWTVDVPRVLENKTGSELMQYAKPLATELDNKQVAFARLKCIELQGDGTGIHGVVSSVSYSGDSISIVIDSGSENAGRSWIRWFQEGDLFKIRNNLGAARKVEKLTGTSNAADVTPDYVKVVEIDEAASKVVFEAYTDSDDKITGLAAASADAIAASNVLQRIGTSGVDVSSPISAEYSTLSEVMVGLESLIAADGRLVHGLKREGALKGTERDLGGVAIDSKHFQQILSRLKVNAGKGRYKYPSAFMSDLTYDALVEARETDRRFHSIEDSDRGVKGIGYVHGKDRVEFMPDEFVHGQRIWILPEGKDALCYVGKDPQQVKPNGNDAFHLTTSTSGSGYGRDMQTFFEQTGVLLAKHPAACGVLKNFTATSF
jgi:hypothetical protein